MSFDSASPFFSIITPAFNCSRYIIPCIESVQSQDFESFEHIIVDDCSTDDPFSLICSYQDSRVIPLQIFDSSQPARTRNFGITHARGKYICFLDADDVFLPGKLQLLYSYLAVDSYDFIFHDEVIVDSFGSFIESRRYGPPIFLNSSILYAFGNRFSTSTVTISRSFLQRAKIVMSHLDIVSLRTI